MVRLAQELREQSRWRVRERFAGMRTIEALVHGEFMPPAELQARDAAARAMMFRHAAAESPFWAARLARADAGLKDSHALPILRKDEIRDNAEAMLARNLPAGEVVGTSTSTSGSTGMPLSVPHSARSIGAFGLLRQRAMRWFRFDPARLLGASQPTSNLPRQPDGSRFPDGVTLRLPSWLNVGHLFHTGACIAIGHTTPVAQQVDWLERERPAYLIALGAYVEALAWQSRARPDFLHGIYAISQTMTPAMRALAERELGAPVGMLYGLNELGIVAARCHECGRYHVNAEYCHLEIVDEEGRPCRAGERGRIVVTSLADTAMPLLRYDTDDLADAVDGPCPCGRTLPAFGEVHGRYRRIAYLPPGTFEHWAILQRTISGLPAELLAPLRQYQLYQHRDRSCELRLVNDGPLAPAFEQRVRDAWRAVDGDAPMPLTLLHVDGSTARPPAARWRTCCRRSHPGPAKPVSSCAGEGAERRQPAGYAPESMAGAR